MGLVVDRMKKQSKQEKRPMANLFNWYGYNSRTLKFNTSRFDEISNCRVVIKKLKVFNNCETNNHNITTNKFHFHFDNLIFH